MGVLSHVVRSCNEPRSRLRVIAPFKKTVKPKEVTQIMADSTAAAEKVTTAATKAAVNRIAKEAVANAVADQALPSVVETTALSVEVPSKVILNQKVLFAIGFTAGALVGAGLVYGAFKLHERRVKAKVENQIAEATATIATPNTGKTSKP